MPWLCPDETSNCIFTALTRVEFKLINPTPDMPEAPSNRKTIAITTDRAVELGFKKPRFFRFF